MKSVVKIAASKGTFINELKNEYLKTQVQPR